MIDQTPYFFAFSMFHGIGPQHFSRILNAFETPQNAFNAHVSELVNVLGESLAKKLRTFRSSFDPIAEYDSLLNKGIQYIHINAPQYPTLLRSISDPPIGLFVVGNVLSLTFSDHMFAIVGTRNPSDYGEHIAKKFALELSSYGFTIVSGMAMGIDSCAHRGAIEAGGKTVAVLGCGVNNVPSSRATLYKNIIASGGAVVSEFPPNEYVQKGFFVTRNRIVSGMSNGIMVVEGTDQSGTLITAEYAANQGKDVFAPPVPLTSILSQAPNILLRQGAKLVTCTEDILEEYGIHAIQKSFNSIMVGRSNDEKAILSLLNSQPLSANELSKKSSRSIITVLTIISILEIDGIVQKQRDGNYTICYS